MKAGTLKDNRSNKQASPRAKSATPRSPKGSSQTANSPHKDKKPRHKPAANPRPRKAGPQARQKPKDNSLSGLAARQLSVSLLDDVLMGGRSFDDALRVRLAEPAGRSLSERDRAFSRALAAAVLRRHGQLGAVLDKFLEKPLPIHSGSLKSILLSGCAQLLILRTPPHAAISLAVDQCRADRRAARFDKLVNAILRRVSREGGELFQAMDIPSSCVPPWLWSRWCAHYGETKAHAIAMASIEEAALDISVKHDPAGWATRLGGIQLSTGTVRLQPGGRIEKLKGYRGGAWWVQDAAAALPARLLPTKRGSEVADLCAAPGGKTAQLCMTGVSVTAVDSSGARLERVRENMHRLELSPQFVVADASTWKPDKRFDAILLDAPCTATGTIRRHPDILHLKRETDIETLAELQARLLDNAVSLLKPGGTLVYCTCSLEPEESERQIACLLARNSAIARDPIKPNESGIDAEWITENGDLRTLPCHSPAPVTEGSEGVTNERSPLGGMDGFFAARLRHTG